MELNGAPPRYQVTAGNDREMKSKQHPQATGGKATRDDPTDRHKRGGVGERLVSTRPPYKLYLAES